MRDLTVDRGGRRVLDGLSLDVAAGEGLAVTGQNGTGKSTLLRVLAGLLKPTGGELTFVGADPERSIGAFSHYVGHLDAVKSQETVSETMAFWATWLGGAADIDAIEDALVPLELDHLIELPTAFLSAGQKRRLALSRLNVARRPIWLLDEPTSALDVASEGRFAAMMDAHLDAGGLIVAATHAPLGVSRLSAFPLTFGEG
ncbi:heme ABC exporter ATP-binding protein CcmA [Amorphus sp. 3PC139-8]|uniref:heme ABC exporter ATP-binding protein CcmA n=1 Tax=Amorphus sp. 3PC139-8 TaxID=2735676 RepID=UPI00345C979B